MACAGLLPGLKAGEDRTIPRGSTALRGMRESGLELETDSLLALMVGRKPFPQEWGLGI